MGTGFPPPEPGSQREGDRREVPEPFPGQQLIVNLLRHLLAVLGSARPPLKGEWTKDPTAPPDPAARRKEVRWVRYLSLYLPVSGAPSRR